MVGLRAASGRFQGGCGRFQSQKWEVCWREGITRLPNCEVSGRKAQGGWKVSGRKLVKIGRFEAEKGGGGGRFESEIRKVSGREEGPKKVSGREVDVSASTSWMMTPYSLSLFILTGDRNRFGTGALVPQTPPRRASFAPPRPHRAPRQALRPRPAGLTPSVLRTLDRPQPLRGRRLPKPDGVRKGYALGPPALTPLTPRCSVRVEVRAVLRLRCSRQLARGLPPSTPGEGFALSREWRQSRPSARQPLPAPSPEDSMRIGKNPRGGAGVGGRPLSSHRTAMLRPDCVRFGDDASSDSLRLRLTAIPPTVATSPGRNGALQRCTLERPGDLHGSKGRRRPLAREVGVWELTLPRHDFDR